MTDDKPIRLALIWAQYAAYHVDRCEAVAARLGARARVTAIEVATTSHDYAWEPSSGVAGADKITLFPGMAYDAVPVWRRVWALWKATRHCDWVMIGLSYAEPTALLLSWLLMLGGVRVVVLSESKEDDKPRRSMVEFAKRAALTCYCAAIVGARRHLAYLRQLGFVQRPLLPGYDGVSVDRVRIQADNLLAPAGAPFAAREFLFVGRFVDKKNLITLVEGFAWYAGQAEEPPRRLVLVGSGELEPQIRARIDALGIAHLVDLPGFLSAAQVSSRLASALALVLVSREEQWGLVVNEALSLGLPALISHQVGSGDALVRDRVNGFIVDSEDPAAIGAAMLALGADEGSWERMVAASHARSWLGDTGRLADAVEDLLFADGRGSTGRIGEFLAEAG